MILTESIILLMNNDDDFGWLVPIFIGVAE